MLDPPFIFDVGECLFKARWPASRGCYLVAKPAIDPANIKIARVPWEYPGAAGRGLCVVPLMPLPLSFGDYKGERRGFV